MARTGLWQRVMCCGRMPSVKYQDVPPCTAAQAEVDGLHVRRSSQSSSSSSKVLSTVGALTVHQQQQPSASKKEDHLPHEEHQHDTFGPFTCGMPSQDLYASQEALSSPSSITIQPSTPPNESEVVLCQAAAAGSRPDIPTAISKLPQDPIKLDSIVAPSMPAAMDLMFQSPAPTPVAAAAAAADDVVVAEAQQAGLCSPASSESAVVLCQAAAAGSHPDIPITISKLPQDPIKLDNIVAPSMPAAMDLMFQSPAPTPVAAAAADVVAEAQQPGLCSPASSVSVSSSFSVSSDCSFISFGCHADTNQRSYMEDRTVTTDLTHHPVFEAAGCKRAGLFAVFDGHAGHEAAQFLKQHLLSLLLSHPLLVNSPQAALAAAVRQAEQALLDELTAAGSNAGSTLLAVLLIDGAVYTANVGDCRAVLGSRGAARQLTVDHKPSCTTEEARITAVGGHVSCDGYLYGELGVARALGSPQIKRDPCKQALIADPELSSVQLQQEDDFVVLASDGVWDTVGNSEAVQVVRRGLAAEKDCAAAARALVDRAQRMGSSDNISAVVVLLHDRELAMPKSNSMLFRRRQLGASSSSGSSSSTNSIVGMEG